jgi:predicted chitinase
MAMKGVTRLTSGIAAGSEADVSAYCGQVGDTLSKLAFKHGLPVYDLLRANPQVKDAAASIAGQAIIIPPREVVSNERPRGLSAMKTTCSFAGVGGLSTATFMATRGVDVSKLDKTPPRAAEPAARANAATPQTEDCSGVTREALKAIMPAARDQDIDKYLGPINRAMAEFGVTTPKRKAAFLAQLAVESGSLRYDTELASGEAYEGRAGLGNTEPGDGPRFKGRGLIQLTGRANYKRIGEALGLDLENDPELAADPANSARIAAYFFKSRGLNEIADRGDIELVSRRVNGGTNGLAARIDFFNRGCDVLMA